MTMGGYGYRLPIQGRMLGLAAINTRLYPRQQMSDDELASMMQRARVELVQRLGVDYGYDLLAWHNYLMSDPKLALRYTYSESEDDSFCQDILDASTDSRRTQLIANFLEE